MYRLDTLAKNTKLSKEQSGVLWNTNLIQGQSVDLKHLAPFIKKSYDKYLTKVSKDLEGVYLPEEDRKLIIEKLAMSLTKKEVKDGIQTVQYQVNTLDKIGA